MTFRRPSRTSLSLRLSKSFLVWANGRSRLEARTLTVRAEPADCAASRVNSRANPILALHVFNLHNHTNQYLASTRSARSTPSPDNISRRFAYTSGQSYYSVIDDILAEYLPEEAWHLRYRQSLVVSLPPFFMPLSQLPWHSRCSKV
jgi:hypothetical protein